MDIVSLKEEPYWESRIRELLNRGLERDFILPHTYRRVVVEDPNRDPGLILLAVREGEALGVLIGVRRVRMPPEVVKQQLDVAWIKAIAVPPEYRGQGVLEELYRVFRDMVKDLGCRKIRFADFASWYFFPGLDILYIYYLEALTSLGFRKVGQVVDYELDMRNFFKPPFVEKLEARARSEGITVRRPEPSEKDRVVKWVKEKFSPYWGYEVSCGFKEDRITVWIAEREGQILGFSAYSVLEPNWFGPIGVDPDARGKGLGTILLYRALESLRIDGYRHVVIPWTDHLFFYTQLPCISGVRHYLRIACEIEG